MIRNKILEQKMISLSEEEYKDILSICHKEKPLYEGEYEDEYFSSYETFIEKLRVHANIVFLICGLEFKKFKLKNYKNYVLTLEKDPDKIYGCMVLRSRNQSK